VSSKCQKAFAPKIVDWLLERETPPKPKRKPEKKSPERRKEPVGQEPMPMTVSAAHMNVTSADPPQHAPNP